MNALVVQSNPQPDGEHLEAVFWIRQSASSSMSGMLVDKAIARAFHALVKEGVAYGWKDLPDAEAMAPDTVHLDPLRYESLLASEQAYRGSERWGMTRRSQNCSRWLVSLAGQRCFR